MTSEPPLRLEAIERLRRMGGAQLVRRLIEMFLANGPDRIRILLEAVAAGDAAGVERSAHTMKSSAGNVGAVRLQEAAEQLESAASAGRIDRAVVTRLVREHEASVAALRTLLEEQPE